jgi:hypothetical protein
VSITLIAIKSQDENLHAVTNSVVQFLALGKGDEARCVPRKSVQRGDDVLVQAVRSALDESGLW